MAPHMKDFFREDFHPWDQDDSELIEDWKEKSCQPQFNTKLASSSERMPEAAA